MSESLSRREQREAKRAAEKAAAAAFMADFNAAEKLAKVETEEVEFDLAGDALEVGDRDAAAERASLAAQEEEADRLYGQA